VDEISKSDRLSFSRPFFGETGRMDYANYLAPAWSVGGISVGIYRSDTPSFGVSEPNVAMPVYYIPVILKELPERSAWKDGRHQVSPPLPSGTICSFDLRYRWETELNYAFHTVSFYIPQLAFDELTKELCQPPVVGLRCSPSQVTPDPTAYYLARTLETIIGPKEAIPSLLADQILIAIRLHLAAKYGGLRLPQPADEPRFDIRQIRNLKSMMLDEPWRNVRLAELAIACGMPLHTFERRFRKQFGKTPHQWRLAAKVEHARKLLQYSRLSLAEIAFKCGFSDQAHFTRVFFRMTGLPPGAYRKTCRR
jgi:AraC family transcriptional regulator